VKPLPRYRVTGTGPYAIESTAGGQWQAVITGLDRAGVDRVVRGLRRARVEGWGAPKIDATGPRKAQDASEGVWTGNSPRRHKVPRGEKSLKV
jgi:hypothetical protein